ncbi:MAG: hypothetical protein QOE61_4098, partial [Micromonosporaceae bacterium]|nr:hypothetical protein [Micromonosporaceae bacterium]
MSFFTHFRRLRTQRRTTAEGDLTTGGRLEPMLGDDAAGDHVGGSDDSSLRHDDVADEPAGDPRGKRTVVAR